MPESTLTLPRLLAFLNVSLSSVLVILAFSLLAYTLTYNFRDKVARRFALMLACVMIVYAGDVALAQVASAASATRWLRFQWLGIALLPATYYTFSNAVLRTTNYRLGYRHRISLAMFSLGIASALAALFTDLLVGDVVFTPPISYLQAGPLFWLFAVYFCLGVFFSLLNIWKARNRCLTENSRRRMNYLLLGFVAPGVGIFPYLIAMGRNNGGVLADVPIFLLSLLGDSAVAVLLVLMSYTVAYFGVLTPDRVVRYRLIRFFTRGPAVAILVILAIQTIPTVERILGLPRNVVLFSVITGVMVLSQLALSITKALVDRLIYREDREEIAWLRELDRRLLTTSDLREFLENHLTALCELLQVPAGFVAGAVGSELLLEAEVGPADTRNKVLAVEDWTEALNQALRQRQRLAQEPDALGTLTREGQPLLLPLLPIYHAGFWLWPLMEPVSVEGKEQVLGALGVVARTQTPLFTQDERAVLNEMLERVELALADRKLQQQVFVALRRIIPDIERIQQMRNIVPYSSQDQAEPASELLNPSPIHNPEFEAWVKDALSHYWGGPKLTHSPLIQLRVVAKSVERADGSPTKALRLVLGNAIANLRPKGKQDLSTPEWLLYNILELRFIQGRKVREIAERLAISESDLYRKQRVAIGQVARMLTEMEHKNGEDFNLPILGPTPEAAAIQDADIAAEQVPNTHVEKSGPASGPGQAQEADGRATTEENSLP